MMDHRPEKILCDCLLGPHGTVRGSWRVAREKEGLGIRQGGCTTDPE